MSGVVAKLNHLRMSPRKVRLVADLVRGMDVDDATVHLERLPKRAAGPVRKLLESAIANAAHNFQKNRAQLFIQAVTVDKGPVLKRFRPRAFGRAADIHKHTSHITLTLGERTEQAKKRFTVRTKEKEKPQETGTLEEMSEVRKKPESEFAQKDYTKEPRTSMKKKFVDAGRKFFRRKSV